MVQGGNGYYVLVIAMLIDKIILVFYELYIEANYSTSECPDRAACFLS